MRRIEALSPVLSTLFFTLSVLSLITLGGYLQRYLQLTGVVLMQALIFLGLAAGFAWLLDQRPVTQLFRLRLLTVRGLLKSLLLGLMAWGLAQLLGMLMLAVLELMGGRMPDQYQLLLEAPYPVALLAGAVVPAICEEAAFRGYMLSNLRPLGPGAAVLLTGLLFGLMHLSLVRLLPLAILGLLFAAAVERSGSLLPGMLMHFVNNAIALTLAFLLESTPEVPLAPESVLPGGPSIPGILAIIALAGLLGAAAWAVLRTFGPGDLAGPADPPAIPAPEPLPWRLAALRWLLTLVPLIPAALIYLWAVGSELAVVFGPAL